MTTPAASPKKTATPPDADKKVQKPQTPRNSPPPWLPKRFWDDDGETVLLEELAKAYTALEQDAARPTADPDRPGTAEEYRIEIAHDLFQADAELNRMLFSAGFTRRQAQMVYDLAAEKLLPIAEEIAREHHVALQTMRLEEYFGGREKWRIAARQIRDWGRANLPPEIYEALADSCEGVISMQRMMTGGGEPGLLREGVGPTATDEKSLRRLIRSPRYWRERDPAAIRRVREGFERLYADG